VQVKQYNQNNHIYYYGNNITIAGVQQACPNTTFTIPAQAIFIINGRMYKVGEFRIHHHQQIDPLFSLKANMYFRPVVHNDLIMSQYTNRSNKRIADKDWAQLPQYAWYVYGIIAFFMIAFLLGVVYCFRKIF